MEVSDQDGTVQPLIAVRPVELAGLAEPKGPVGLSKSVELTVQSESKVRIGTAEPSTRYPTAAPRELHCYGLAPLHPLARPADHRCARRCGVAAAFLVRWSIYALSARPSRGSLQAVLQRVNGVGTVSRRSHYMTMS